MSIAQADPKNAAANQAGQLDRPAQPTAARLALQARVDALAVPGTRVEQPNRVAPWITPGLRLLDSNLLFLGLGLGLVGVSDDGPSGFAISPTVAVDLVQTRHAVLHAVGWINTGSTEPAGESPAFFWGMQGGLGLRAPITPGLAVGGELGWGFTHINRDAGEFAHGVFATILIECSMRLERRGRVAPAAASQTSTSQPPPSGKDRT